MKKIFLALLTLCFVVSYGFCSTVNSYDSFSFILRYLYFVFPIYIKILTFFIFHNFTFTPFCFRKHPYNHHNIHQLLVYNRYQK